MERGAGRPPMPCTRLNSLVPSSLSLHSARWISAGHGKPRRHNGDLIQFIDAVDPPIVYLIVHFFADTSPKIGIFCAAGQIPGVSGDRDTGDYPALRRGRWDAVVDVSGYVPRHVGQAMDALGDRAGRYLFISSHAVYQRAGVSPGSTEDTPRRPPVRDTEELDEETYGRLKVACEDDVTARYGSRATIVRPGKVAGPHDPQDGLNYWVRRAARGGRVAVPGDPAQPIQIIDVPAWPAWWCNCSPTTGRARFTRSGRPAGLDAAMYQDTASRLY